MGEGRIEQGPPIRWATNAPAHWPPLVMPAPPITNEENPILAPMFFAQAMINALKEAGATLDLHDILLAHPYPAGVLDVPFRVLDGEMVVPVFYYSQVDEAAGARFAGIAGLMEADGVRPVYYAASPLPEVPPVSPLRPFNLEEDLVHEEQPEEAFASGEYAMWWTEEVPVDFRERPGIRDITRAYRALAGIQAYAWGRLVELLGFSPPSESDFDLEDGEGSEQDFTAGDGVSDQEGEWLDDDAAGSSEGLPLPEHLYVATVEGFGERFLLSASAEKGIRLHFSIEETSEATRDLIWQHVADALKRLRNDALNAGFRPADSSQDAPLGWWSLTESLVASELVEKPCKIGLIAYQPPEPDEVQD